MAADKPFKTFADLATHLQSGESHQIFAEQGNKNIVMTTNRGRGSPQEARLQYDESVSPNQVASARGYNDIKQLADASITSDEQLGQQLTQMRAFVKAQSEQVAAAWGDRAVTVFKRRASVLLGGAIADKFRTAAGTKVGGHKTKGWDENVQTEIVSSRIGGRQQALDELSGNPRHAQLMEMHALMAESSSLARTPSAVVGGSLDAFSGAAAAHPGPRAANAGSAMGNSVGASPNAHSMRTGIMQAFEEQADIAGANVAERQMARVLMAKRTTTNAFEAPPIPGTTNKSFGGSTRDLIIDAGRRKDKVIYSNLRTAATEIGGDSFKSFINTRTRSSSGVWPKYTPPGK